MGQTARRRYSSALRRANADDSGCRLTRNSCGTLCQCAIKHRGVWSIGHFVVGWNTLSHRRFFSFIWTPLGHWNVLRTDKTRLTLENFTGLGVKAVKQDFYATVYLSGLESILTDTAQAILDAKETQYPQKANRAVSFNAIKTPAFTLLMSNMATEVIFQRLTAMFLKNTCLERKDRNPPRKKSSATVLLNYHKRLKKQCY